jgi:hypothetical protein
MISVYKSLPASTAASQTKNGTRVVGTECGGVGADAAVIRRHDDGCLSVAVWVALDGDENLPDQTVRVRHRADL